MSNLLPEDKEYLKIEHKGKYKLLEEEQKRGLLIHEYSLPEGYTSETTDLMLLIPDSYPAAALDMFYFCPAISRQNGIPIGALANEEHFGKTWQRWSRHYEWKVGEHNIASHLRHVRSFLEAELGK